MDFLFEVSPREINMSMMRLRINFIKAIAEDAEFEDITEEYDKNGDNTVHPV